MKIIWVCQKHYDSLMASFKEEKLKDPLPLGASLGVGALGFLYGMQVKFIIKPYLKKMRIMDTDKFEMQMPYDPYEARRNIRKLKLSGLEVA